MADPGLVKQMVEAGCESDAATAAIEAVTAAMLVQLRANKSVVLNGVGTLKAPEKVVETPFPPGKLRVQRKVFLRGAVIEAGEPYDRLTPKPKRRYYGNGVMA